MEHSNEGPFPSPRRAGEDYELLFAVPPGKRDVADGLARSLDWPLTAIGTIQPGTGRLAVQEASGAVHPLRAGGYDHFCRS